MSRKERILHVDVGGDESPTSTVKYRARARLTTGHILTAHCNHLAILAQPELQ
jgi:hypothetical protein